MHANKRAIDTDPCTSYQKRFIKDPPFSTLSLDATTFMCNFGCSVVTQDVALIVRHLLEKHSDKLEMWCMKEEMMRATLKYLDGQAEKSRSRKK